MCRIVLVATVRESRGVGSLRFCRTSRNQGFGQRLRVRDGRDAGVATSARAQRSACSVCGCWLRADLEGEGAFVAGTHRRPPTGVCVQEVASSRVQVEAAVMWVADHHERALSHAMHDHEDPARSPSRTCSRQHRHDLAHERGMSEIAVCSTALLMNRALQVGKASTRGAAMQFEHLPTVDAAWCCHCPSYGLCAERWPPPERAGDESSDEARTRRSAARSVTPAVRPQPPGHDRAERTCNPCRRRTALMAPSDNLRPVQTTRRTAVSPLARCRRGDQIADGRSTRRPLPHRGGTNPSGTRDLAVQRLTRTVTRITRQPHEQRLTRNRTDCPIRELLTSLSGSTERRRVTADIACLNRQRSPSVSP